MPSYGPTLPPGFERPGTENSNSATENPDLSVADHRNISPESEQTPINAAPVIGPVIPSHLLGQPTAESSKSEDPTPSSNEIVVGPVLPPGFERPKIISGPQIPAGFKKKVDDSDESDDEFVGPSPVLMAEEGDYSGVSELTRRLERQAKREREAAEPKVLARETWMTSLPDSLLAKTIAPALTAAPRSFKRRTDDYEADFSGWTAGPGAKGKEEKKEVDTLEVLQYQQAIERERQLELQIEKHNKKKRGESLVSIAKKEMPQEVNGERRPFDREKDINIQKVGRMDADDMRKKADALKERFASSGKAGQKFL